MTSLRGRDEPANPSGGPPAEPPLDLARFAADLEPRAARLERFVEGLASVLQRFEERAQSENPAAIFGDFEAPDASHEALRVLTEASTSARHDLAVLRRDVRPIVRASPSNVEPAIVGRIREIGLTAGALAARYEAFATAARAWLAAPRAGEQAPTPAAVDGLRAFTTIADRALRDVAEAAFIIQREDGHDEFGVLAGTGAAGTAAAAAAVSATASTTAIAAKRRLPSVRQGAVLAAAAAGASWKGLSFAALRESRALISLGATGAVAGVVLVAVIASNGLPSGPTFGPSGAISSAGSSPSTSDGGVAVGSASPATSPGVSPGDSAGPSLEPGQTPAPTPRPGSSPAPSTPGSTPGPSAGSSPGPSNPPTPTPPGATPTPPGATPPPTPTPTPVPTPTPTLEPGAAAAQFASRVTAGANAADALLDQITVAVQDSDFVLAESLAEDLENLAAAERAWLQGHPPAACYQTHHTTALARYAELIATAVEIQADAAAENANAIHNDVASGNADVAALKQAANKAVAACP